MAAVCPVGNHGMGRHIIREIMRVQAIPGCTAYDTLRLPMYKTWQQHQDNHDLLYAELVAGIGCTCANRANALAAVRAAFQLIVDVPTKAAYDAALMAQPIPGTVVPIRLGVHPALVGALRPHAEFGFDHPLTNIIRRVEYYSTTDFVKLDRSARLLFRRIEYSFWFALAMALYDDESFWAEINDTVCVHSVSIMLQAADPRCTPYWSLACNGIAAGRPSVMDQFSEDRANDPPIVPPMRPFTLASAGPEMWQLVADTYKIELLVIIAHIPVTRDRHRRFKTVIPRGDHNNKQVILLLDEDGEYRAIRPLVDNPAQWRFENHMPPHHPKAATNQDQIDTRDAELLESNLRRCPLVQTTDRFIPTHIDPLVRGGPAVPPAGILLRTRFLPPPFAPFLQPFEPLPPLIHDPHPVTPVSTAVHLNPPSGRWI